MVVLSLLDERMHPAFPKPEPERSRSDALMAASASFPTDSSRMDFWPLWINRKSFYTSSLSWLQIGTVFPFIPMMPFAPFYISL